MTGAERAAGRKAAYARPGFNMPKLWRWMRRAFILWGACASLVLGLFNSFLRAHPESMSPDMPTVSGAPIGFVYGRPRYTVTR